MTQTKKEILKQVYEHLRSLGKVHTKKDFATEIDFDYTNLSSAFNGVNKYLTAGLFEKIHQKYPDIFNIEYLRTGDGNMILEPEKKAVTEPAPSQEDVKMPREVFSLLATQVETLKSQQETIRSQQELINRLVKPDVSQ